MNTKLIALPERAMEMAGKWGGEVMDFVPGRGQVAGDRRETRCAEDRRRASR